MFPIGASDAEVIALVIAGYAAVVSTLAAGAQVFSFFLNWRTRIELRVSAKALTGSQADPELVILMELVNHGDWPVKAANLAFMPQKKFPRLRRNASWLVIPRPFPVEEPLPITIPAHDSKLIWVTRDEMAKSIDFSKRVRIQISTTTGKAFRSKWTSLDFAEPKSH